jgi:hypothetical protein
VQDLALAGSTRGDALAGFLQEAQDARSIGVAVVDAPPGALLLLAPEGWQRGRPRLTWDPAPNSLGPVRYTLLVDGRRVLQTAGLTARLGPRAVADGRHRVRIVASDGAGQTSETQGELLIDRRPPRVRLTRRGAAVRVSISDGRPRSVSGVAIRHLSVSWGDGRRSRRAARTAHHRYARPGRYRVVVLSRDRAGNRVVLRRRVSVR